MFRRAKPCRYVANSTHCVLRTCARSSPTAGNKKTDTPDLGVTLLRRISGREVKRREPSPRCFARRNRAAMLRTPRTACFALVHEVLRPQSAKRAIHHFGCMALFGAPAENRTPDTLIKSQNCLLMKGELEMKTLEEARKKEALLDFFNRQPTAIQNELLRTGYFRRSAGEPSSPPGEPQQLMLDIPHLSRPSAM